MLSDWYQKLMKDNWGVTAHFFICYLWAFAWTGLSVNWSVDLRYAIGSLITLVTYFVMIVYEKNQTKNEGQPIKGMVEDIVANNLGFVVGVTSAMGVFYV